MASAGSSPPVSTKSPMEISSGGQVLADALVEALVRPQISASAAARTALADSLGEVRPGRHQDDGVGAVDASPSTLSTAWNTARAFIHHAPPPP